MEDFLRFAVIAGIILISIVKHFRKNNTKNPAGIPSDTQPEIIEEVFPVPPASRTEIPSRRASAGKADAYIPPHERRAATQRAATEKQKATSRQEKLRTFLPGESAGRNAQQSKPTPGNVASKRASTGSKAANDYSISSAEEARKAIIWAEVLQRKY